MKPTVSAQLADGTAAAVHGLASTLDKASTTSLAQPEQVDFTPELLGVPVACKVSVDARSRRGGDERSLVVAEHRPEVGHEGAVVSQVVLLVVVLGDPEALERLDARRERAPSEALRQALRARMGRSELLVGVSEHERRILPLVRGPRGIVREPYQLEQVVVTDDLRVEFDLEALRLVAQIAIGGIGVVAASVARTCAPDTLDSPEPGVRCPESTYGEGRGLELSR